MKTITKYLNANIAVTYKNKRNLKYKNNLIRFLILQGIARFFGKTAASAQQNRESFKVNEVDK